MSLINTDIEVITIGGSSVLGTLITMNNHGILVSNLVTSLEVEKLESILIVSNEKKNYC